MKLRITKANGSLRIDIPSELVTHLSEGESLELDLSVHCSPSSQPSALAKTSAPQSKNDLPITNAERELMLKLNAVKFDKRVPTEVNKLLSDKERETLAYLLEKRYVIILKSKKYPSGVYNIDDKVYPALKREPTSSNPNAYVKPAASVQQASSQASSATTSPSSRSASSAPSNSSKYGEFADLFNFGFMVVENEVDAKRFSEQFGDKIKNGDITGIRGFDKKFYVCTKSFFLEHESSVLRCLTKEAKQVEQIATETSLLPSAVLILLTLMADSGDIIEKRRGFFARA